MSHRILVIGSPGLTGSALEKELGRRDVDVVRFDLRAHDMPRDDARERADLIATIGDIVSGVVARDSIAGGELRIDGADDVWGPTTLTALAVQLAGTKVALAYARLRSLDATRIVGAAARTEAVP